MKRTSAFTLVEMLVVVSIIAVIAGLAFPAISGAITRAQLTQEVSNARQLYLAGFQMATDGSTNADANLAWPGASPVPTTLADYMSKLVSNGYLQTGDIPKVLSAPGAVCTASATTTGNTTTVTLGGKSALKIYPVTDTDASNTIFAVSSNYTYDTALSATAGAQANTPFGDKGFVVVRKGGDASSLRKNNAAAAGTDATSVAAFESVVGKKPGEAAGTVTAGDPAATLHEP